MAMKSDKEFDNLAEILRILGNPLRLKILALCAKREHSSRELREKLNISKPLLIAHLKKLQKIGLIEAKVEINKDTYTLRKYYRTAKFKITISDEKLKEMI